MVINCISNRKDSIASYKNLTIGKKYEVISVHFGVEVMFSDSLKSSVQYRVINDNGLTAIYPENLFEIITQTVDDDWVIFKNNQSLFSILPESFAYEGFWSDFIDHNKDARNLFSYRYPELAELLF
ncbi:hypothetical protein [uncultured Microscilla sp.]|uniref:hypothetical protein n=1 Tax=uncultured Microscilla sp. TaxID=432653 RepID=UPI00261BCA36|nr:hypothetical protein [uncultured Microscilla sp.]